MTDDIAGTTGESDTKRRGFLQGLAALGLLGGTTTVLAGRPDDAADTDRRELLVGTDETTDVATVESEVTSELPGDARVRSRNETLGYLRVVVPDRASSQDTQALTGALEQRPGVSYAEENSTYRTMLAPNDPGFDSQYAPQQVNAPEAWDVTLGSTDVTIAVIDTGADYSHEDLSELYASDPGYDFVDGDSDPYPSDGGQHGTHVSGCASADTDNGIGVAGVSDSRLINGRVLGGGTGGTAAIADAIQWAADQGVDIVNMSLGGGGYSETMKNAVVYAAERDVLLLAAAGNDGNYGVSYPAAYEECVAVSAVDPNENLANFSQYGPAIEVAAPGVNVLSTVPGDDYAEFSGTSMATPVAAGVAALGKAADPSLSAAELREKLTSTAVDIGLSSEQQGAGRVDAANIVDSGGGTDPGGPISDGVYRITNVHSGKALDVSGQSTETGANVHQWEYFGNDNQHWEVESLDDGTYAITSVHSGKVLDVAGFSTDNGGNVQQWDWYGSDNQRWQIESLGDGEYAITSVNSGKVLDVAAFSTENGGNVHQWEWFGSDNQRWKLEPL